jgi:hypothetical protein
VDISARHHQIRLREKNEAKTAWQTHKGHYEYEVMPYGLTRVPTKFQVLLMAFLFSHLSGKNTWH